MGTEKMFRPGAVIYFVGIKGTGVCALAELMHNAGMKVSGSDIPEVFYTDVILNELKIPFFQNFDASRITADIDVVIHSPAYDNLNPELARAAQLNIPILKYPDALGAWSAKFDSIGICGVHGKTTTTALAGVLMRAAGIPAQILTGSAAADFGGRSTLILGNKYFIAEACEYREHFLSFHPKRIILTSVESDHQDYFPDYESIRDAFLKFCRMLPAGGELIFCADDPGASEVAQTIEKENRGIVLVPYGFTANGDYKILSYNTQDKTASFSVAGLLAEQTQPAEFKLKIPGRHQALNATAALALAKILTGNVLTNEQIELMKTALEKFESSKRRSEVYGEAGGIIFMDDYGHHPTAIKTTLCGIKSFYPSRRLIVSFMSHTYTRTSALLDRFASAFSDADILFLHKIYSSARENYSGRLNDKIFYDKTAQMHSDVRYTDEPLDAFQPLCETLKPGDIFLTMGAGNNWPLAEKLFAHYKSIDEQVIL